MVTDVMRVRLHLRQIRVLEVLVDTPDELRVRVESTVRRPRCRYCGFKCHKGHDAREREVRDPRGVGAARRAGVAAPPVRVRQLRQPLAGRSPRVRRAPHTAPGAAVSSRTLRQ